MQTPKHKYGTLNENPIQSPVLKLRRLHRFQGNTTPYKKGFPWYDTKMNPVVRLKF